MSGKAGPRAIARDNQRGITIGFFSICGACVLARVLDQLLFGEEDGITNEVCAFAAFVVGAVTCLRHRRQKPPQRGPKTHAGAGGLARRAADAEQRKSGSMPRRNSLSRSGGMQATSGPRRSHGEAAGVHAEE
eukprot:CAMPEP_0171225540 /NCGR_PEP_ID=MMETSP0790-20130122/36859_1 /TAXON_ID=2925 /ORGANISM="Alexandrium catenella, Strain OF101" /LENGTH=132 /DNA_ID=CAMNT_0011691575 /DNA_START=111 /DNA_END=506 /DNA_ORIENTATION=+